DLTRLDERAREHEPVAEELAAMDAREHREPDHGEDDARPREASDPVAEERQREQRRHDDVQPGDEPGARHGRVLQPGRLQAVAAGEERAEPEPGADPLPPERAHARDGERREHGGRDREAHCEEREERVELERVLDLHEGDAPDRCDGDEGQEREHVAGRYAARRARRPHRPGARASRYPEPVGPRDTLGRPVRDLRISITDRCNFRCVYCMPKEVFGRDYEFLGRDQLLTFEEIERLARGFVRAGVTKLRLTGGEPLVRRGVEELVAMLADIPGADVTMTTNGALLAGKARALGDAGLTRITVSLDSLDDGVFRAMNDVDFPVARVLEGIDAAAAAGLAPIKVNMVVRRGLNEESVVPMARRFHGTGHILRFIEYMDVGHSNGWRLDEVVPAAELVAAIDAELPLEAVPPNYPGEVATRWRYRDGGGEIGVISSVTQPFCGACTRARLSADGTLYTCLFAVRGHDLRGLVRGGATDAELDARIARIWGARADRYSELRTERTAALPKVEMSYIGG